MRKSRARFLYFYVLIVSIVINTGCVSKGTVLQQTWPVNFIGPHLAILRYYYAPVKNGCIFLKSNDKLSGIIKFVANINKSSSYIQILPSGKTKKKDVLNVQRADINFVRLYSDNFKDTIHFIDYKNIDGKEIYWRLYAEKNDVSIYTGDPLYTGNEKITDYYSMLLVKNKDTINMGNSFGFFHKPYCPEKYFLNFINKEYKTHYKIVDFKDETSMIDYILNKEMEK